MSSFTTALIVQRLDNPREWQVVKAFTYEVGAIGSGVVITVPEGFVTDFASIPRFLWWKWPPAGGAYDKAAVVHDFLYRTQFATIARVLSDAVFFDAMVALGNVSWFDRMGIWRGVRLGGWWTIWKYRKAASRAALLVTPEAARAKFTAVK